MKSTRGFSLIELLVALAIGLLIVLALSIVIVRASGAQRDLALANRQLENGRFAMQMLADDLHNAGFVGAVANLQPPVAIPNVCITNSGTIAAEHLKGLGIGVFPSATLPGCIATADHVPGTDVLTVVHASSVATPNGSLVPGRLYVQTDTQSVKLAVAAAATDPAFNLKKKNGVDTADIRELQVYIYFVSPCNRPATGCSAAADDGQPVPTLKRMKLREGAFVTESIAEGIENLQVEIGIDDVAPTDGGPDRYKGVVSTSAPTLVELGNTMAVRVHLLARNTERTAGYNDSGKTYVLPGTTTVGPTTVGPFNDSFRRHVFSRVIRLHNASGRRAS